MTVPILHFSDLLCVWAYVAEARIEQLCADFGEQITVDRHFCSVFGSTREKLEQGWKDRGGIAAYSKHVLGIAARFPHVEMHPEVWLASAPRSSMSPHLALSALRVLEQRGDVESGTLARATWAFRLAFFRDASDIGVRAKQLGLLEELGIPRASIESSLDDGTACAALARDLDHARELEIKVSPTIALNEGRQRLNGNVSYRVIEANVRELLREPAVDAASWC